MGYLLDTHTMLWLDNNSPRLSAKLRKAFLDPTKEFYFSVASIWEISIKLSIKKLQIPCSLREFVRDSVQQNSVQILSIKPDHLYLVEHLPWHHRDPFDRLLIAQCQHENLKIVTADAIFSQYDVSIFF